MFNIIYLILQYSCLVSLSKTGIKLWQIPPSLHCHGSNLTLSNSFSGKRQQIALKDNFNHPRRWRSSSSSRHSRLIYFRRKRIILHRVGGEEKNDTIFFIVGEEEEKIRLWKKVWKVAQDWSGGRGWTLLPLLVSYKSSFHCQFSATQNCFIGLGVWVPCKALLYPSISFFEACWRIPNRPAILKCFRVFFWTYSSCFVLVI